MLVHLQNIFKGCLNLLPALIYKELGTKKGKVRTLLMSLKSNVLTRRQHPQNRNLPKYLIRVTEMEIKPSKATSTGTSTTTP